MMNTCIVKGSCFSSGSPSPNRSNSYSPSPYSNSLHYRDSTPNNLFVNIEAAVELHDLTSRSQQLNNNIKPDVSNIYHHQIQQIQRHHHLNHNALSNHPHLPSPHLINHNLTNHLANPHLINHNLANHPQFANHPQLDEIFSSVNAVAAAAISNLSSSQASNATSPSIGGASVVANSANSNNANNNQTNGNGANSSASSANSNNGGNNQQANGENNSNLMGNVDAAGNEQLDAAAVAVANQQATHSPTGSNQIYTPQQNNMIPNFGQYHQQQASFASHSPNLPQQQQHLHQIHLHSGNQHVALSQQNAASLNQQSQQLSNANALHHVQNHNLNGQHSNQSNQQLQSQSLANSIQQQLQQQHCSLQQQMLQTLQHLPQDGDLMGTDLRELEAFAERFKQRRIKLGVTQADVGRALANLKLPGVGCLSQSTICRFESLTLSHNNMVALKPILCAWLDAAENAARKARAVRDSMDASNLSAINCNGANGLGLGVMSGLLCNGDKKRKRTSIAAPEKRSLEKFFAVQPRPSGEKIAAIADKLELKKNVVRVWFCNQRQKLRRLKYSTGGGQSLD